MKVAVCVMGLVAACGDDGVTKLPDAPPPADAAIDAPVCATATGAGTMHASVTAAETWTAAASPHIIPFDINVSAALTIEPCAVVKIAIKKTVTVQTGGSFIAAGAPGLPVTIDSVVAGMPFAQIRAVGGAISLTHTIVRGGGDPLNTNVALAAAIHLQTGTLHVDDLEIADSKSQGVYIDGPTGFDATSKDLKIHGSAGFPVHTYARVIGSIPTGTYTGNTRDAIGISGSGGSVVSDQTMHDRGVPYHVGSGLDGGRMDVDSTVAGVVAVLTIEAGVTMQFPPGGTLNVGIGAGPLAAKGALIAIGTAQKKITFTSDQGAASAAGDWFGVGFGGTVDSRSVMQNTIVRFAGGVQVTGSNSCPYPARAGLGPNYAAIRIYGPAATQFITNTEIPESARDGIDRGWRDDVQPDFLATNTITVVGCKQTTPALANNGCPATPPCP